MTIMAQARQGTGYSSDSIAEAVKRLEQLWASATKANDPATVDTILSEVFVELDSDGTLYTRSQTLDRIKNDKWQVFEVSDIKVFVHGNMAIATGSWRGKGTLARGKTVDAHEHWLDTWLKNGKWQCVASASAPVKA
jgi:ketosteroid isomerase-like protein